MGADFGRGAYFLGDGKRALEQLRQRAAQCARRVGGAHRVFHLAQDLRLAQDHRVQPAGDAKGVARSMGVLQHIGVGTKFVGLDAAGVGQPGQCALQFRLVTGAINLGAVAGGDDRSLGRTGQGLAQTAQMRLDLVHRKREPSPHIQRSGGVVDAECPDCHVTLIIKSMCPSDFLGR